MTNHPNIEDTQPAYRIPEESPSQPPPPPPGNPFPPGGSPGAVDSRLIGALSGTKPWVRFIAVLGFIMIAFMLVMALFMLAISLFAGDTAGMNIAEAVAVSVIYVFGAILYAFPTVALWKYGSAINTLKANTTVDGLFTALDSQRSFWKIVGIITVIWLILSVLFVIAAVIISFMAIV
ncbi:MAG TPA: DUF5362 family protein [bacterium]|nr:DUF5362 family protein [bacterium]